MRRGFSPPLLLFLISTARGGEYSPLPSRSRHPRHQEGVLPSSSLDLDIHGARRGEFSPPLLVLDIHGARRGELSPPLSILTSTLQPGTSGTVPFTESFICSY